MHCFLAFGLVRVGNCSGSLGLLGHCCESESFQGEESLQIKEVKWLNMEHKAHFAFGDLPASTGGLRECPRAEFDTKVGHPSCGRGLGLPPPQEATL